MPYPGPPNYSNDDKRLYAEYPEVNASFRALAEIRFKLLALVPTVSGLGIALIDQNTKADSPLVALLSLVALTVLLGIVIYDQRNTQFYNRLVGRAQFLEHQMRFLQAGNKPEEEPAKDNDGQNEFGGLFWDRNVEKKKLFGLVPMWHDLGLGLIYSATIGGWLFLLARWGLLLGDTSAATASRVAAYIAVGGSLCFLVELLRLDGSLGKLLRRYRLRKPRDQDEQQAA